MVEDFSLSREQLLQWAIKCTKLREKIREEALYAEKVSSGNAKKGEELISLIATRIEKGYHRTKKIRLRHFQEDAPEPTPPSIRKKLKHRAKLETKEKLDIAYRVIKENELIADLAKEFRVSQARVSQIVSQARKKPEVLAENINKDAEKARTKEDLATFIEALAKSGRMIERAADVKQLYEASRKVEVKVETVRHVMRTLLDMRFTKIVKIPN